MKIRYSPNLSIKLRNENMNFTGSNLTILDNIEPSSKSDSNDFIVACLIIITSLLGLIFYLPCLFAMFLSKKLNSPCYTFMISLAVSDCICLLAWFIIGLDTCTHGTIIPKRLMTVSMCIQSVGWGNIKIHEPMISVNRYIAVCHKDKHDHMFSKNKMIILITVSWLYAVVVDAFPAYVADVYYTLDGYYFGWNNQGMSTYSTYYDLATSSAMFLISILCYVKIIMKFAKVRKEVTAKVVNSHKKDLVVQFKLALQTAIRFLFFFIDDLLYYVVAFKGADMWPTFVVCTYLWCMNNAINGWIFVTFNPQLRKVMKNYVTKDKNEMTTFVRIVQSKSFQFQSNSIQSKGFKELFNFTIIYANIKKLLYKR